MKNIFLLLAGIILITMFSCAKESKCVCTTYSPNDTITTVTNIKGKFEEETCVASSQDFTVGDTNVVAKTKVCVVE